MAIGRDTLMGGRLIAVVAAAAGAGAGALAVTATTGGGASDGRASTKAVHDGKRSPGSLASARTSARSTVAGRSGFTLLGAGSGERIWASITAAGVSAWNGGWPARASKATTPSEYWSEAGPVSPPPHCSGDMYSGVPTTMSRRVSRWLAAIMRARPKRSEEHTSELQSRGHL